ncbi:MAG: hypothetical protein ACJA01_004397, partial [Saprospiraceae bacterium]
YIKIFLTLETFPQPLPNLRNTMNFKELLNAVFLKT